MIISPSISQILRGIIHEIGGDFKTDLDPVKSAQIDTIIGVLGSCAVRADHQAKFIHEEVEAIRSLAQKFANSGQNGADAIRTCLSEMESADSDEALYEKASQTLSAMSDLGDAIGEDFSGELFALLEQRLANEAVIIGGGFEAAGR